jgi:hypothetical protein
VAPVMWRAAVAGDPVWREQITLKLRFDQAGGGLVE